MNPGTGLNYSFSLFKKVDRAFLISRPKIISYQKIFVLFFLFFSLSPILFAQASNESLQNQINELNQTLSLWKGIFVAVVAAFGITGTLIVLYFNKSVDLKKQEKEWEAEKRVQQMEQKVIEGINEKAKTVQLILKKTDEEKTLMKIKKIYLWGEKNSLRIKEILTISGFNLKNLIENENDAIEGYDILFINNDDGELCIKKRANGEVDSREKDFSEILSMVTKQPKNVCIFYYNTTFAHLPMGDLKFDVKHRVNFATNPSQIYGNLLNTLKYHERLRESTEQSA